MADTFQLQVATPERLFVDEQVSEAEIPGKNGYMGILAGHAPLLSALKPGVLTYSGGSGGQHALVIDGGFVEVFDNHFRVLADHAESPENVQVDRARQQLEEANRKLQQARDSSESEAALRSIEQAQARIDASQRSSGRAHG
jgi:F-type H+-transporting ATPase subunit epsilon